MLGVRSWKVFDGRWGSVLVGVRCLSRDIGQATHYTHPKLIARDEILPGIHKNEFAQRRNKLMELLATSHTGMTHGKHVIIIPGAAIKYMSADVPYWFHQHTDMLYLSGFMEPDSVLLLDSHALPQHKAVLYVRPRDPYRELWDGPRAGTEDAVEFTGVDEAYNLEELSAHLENKYSTEGYCVWYHTDTATHPQHAELITEALTRSPHSRIKDVHDPTLNIAKLRLIKSPSEQALMRKAGELAGHAFRAAMRHSHPGVNEGVLESVFEHSVKSNGAQWLSFPPVVAGGNRANCIHYITNNKPIKGGELVLMDAGCEYHGYVSDITRSWPVNGSFTSAQQDLYEVVRTTKEELTQLCRSGTTLNYLHSAANNILATQLKNMGVLSYRISAAQQTQVMAKLFPHHVGHYLGMDTHDTMQVDRNTVLSPGMVITIEPGVYVSQDFTGTPAAKELQGTGIRLEDNVLVTTGEAEVLNKGCPETLEELSELIQPTSNLEHIQ